VIACPDGEARKGARINRFQTTLASKNGCQMGFQIVWNLFQVGNDIGLHASVDLMQALLVFFVKMLEVVLFAALLILLTVEIITVENETGPGRYLGDRRNGAAVQRLSTTTVLCPGTGLLAPRSRLP